MGSINTSTRLSFTMAELNLCICVASLRARRFFRNSSAAVVGGFRAASGLAEIAFLKLDS